MINIEFTRKEIPIPLIYQPLYKLVMLLAVVKYSMSNTNHKASLLHLHIYLWGIRTHENYQVLKDLKAGNRDNIVPWSIEPGLDNVIKLAVINDYCIKEPKSGKYYLKLDSKGNELLTKIEDLNIFDDIDKIKEIGIISYAKLKTANENWTLKD